MAQVTSESVSVDAEGAATRDVNRAIRQAQLDGAKRIQVLNPAGRHSFGVAMNGDTEIVFEGPVGWYAAGMNCGPHVVVKGNAGWGLGECMMDGRIDVHGHAGSGTAASIGIAMKGGTLVVGGNAGYMSGFMMQQGTIVVCGDAADGLADSMYEGTIYVGGRIFSRGADAEIEELTDEDVAYLKTILGEFGIDADHDGFTKIRSGRKLWNFSSKEPELWTSAL